MATQLTTITNGYIVKATSRTTHALSTPQFTPFAVPKQVTKNPKSQIPVSIITNQQPLKRVFGDSKHDFQRVWGNLKQKVKDDVKQWFVERGNRKGVTFETLIAFHREHRNTLEKNYADLLNPTIAYDDYYTQAFHGYEEGNLNWESAEDCLPATLSMSLSYWPGTKPTETQSWFRQNFTEAIKNHASNVSRLEILDIGSSVGVGTRFLLDAFPEAHVSLLDLSPHFLASAKMFLETPGSPLFEPSAKERTYYYHQNAETTSCKAGSFDIISIQFVFHELPVEAANSVMKEAYRLLRPGGTLAILDLDPENILGLPFLRRSLFEISEPHVNDYTRKTNMLNMMKMFGFQNAGYTKNDPMNARWICNKPQTKTN